MPRRPSWFRPHAARLPASKKRLNSWGQQPAVHHAATPALSGAVRFSTALRGSDSSAQAQVVAISWSTRPGFSERAVAWIDRSEQASQTSLPRPPYFIERTIVTPMPSHRGCGGREAAP